jgi:hypothetical protein
VHVEEHVVEVHNGRNVVVVRAAVPRGAHVGKWPNRLRAAWEDKSLNPPCCGHQRVAGGGLGWRQGAVEGGASFWRSERQVDTGGGRRRRQRWKGGGARAAGQPRGGEGQMVWSLCRPRADKELRARGRAGCPDRHISCPNLRPEWMRTDAFGQLCLFGSPCWAMCSVRADAFGCGVVVCVGPLEMPSWHR